MMCLLNPKKRSLYLVFEFAEYELMKILSHLKEHKKITMPPQVVKTFLWQILNAVNYLHTNWIFHRDLKPSNILVMGRGSDSGIVKVADFGLARLFKNPLLKLSDNGVVVTSWYRAPELLLGTRHYTAAIDMWAIGCIFYEMSTGSYLFPGEEEPGTPFQERQLMCIFNRRRSLPTEQEWDLLPHMKYYEGFCGIREKMKFGGKGLVGFRENSPEHNLLMDLLEYNPERRITASDALGHPYFVVGDPPDMRAVQNFLKTLNM
eukprot:TRINITY_DN6374_c1_g2_i3.p1 TRINITY_DN6374_c1_g2~~TRINITY_DN6374_c1_g2_i3.p1  ORF type:complete len:262 (-),score=44.20 TRINITY_DN6374_c1_g2_i3:24-809(-)